MKISVIMPVYNAGKYLKEAIDSILNQTFKDFEFIIINDCSTDNTENIIKSYTDDRIIYLKNEVNLGISDTLNKGISISKGEYIARMDADDISLPNRFEKQVEYMDNHKNVAVLGTGITIFGQGIKNTIRIFPTDIHSAKTELIFTPCTAHPTFFIRKQVMTENNVFYKKYYNGIEDFALLWDISQYGDVLSLKENLLLYRCHDKQVTKTYSDSDKNRFVNFLIYRMKRLGIILDENEIDVFINYCSGNSNDFKYSEIISFIQIMKKICLSNKRIEFFNTCCLQNKLLLSICECVIASKLSKKDIMNISRIVCLSKWLKIFYKIKYLILVSKSKGVFK